MFPRPLVLLAVLSLLYSSSAHVFIRQDDPTATDGTGTDSGDGSSDGGASAAVSADASADPSADGASPSPTDAGASAAAPSTTGSSSTGGVSSLGGAGTGGAYPAACSSCANTFSLIHLCSTQGSSESCSPICTSWTTSTNCLDCLLANGQPNVDQASLQQVVWNLESSCSDLELGVASVDITASPTTTGPFTTPSSAPSTAANGSGSASTSKHSGITVYNTNLHTPSISASTSVAVNPSQTGAASRRGTAWGQGLAAAAGAVGVVAMAL